MTTRSEQELAARARWQRRRRRLMCYGQWEPFVDATPVREHVEAMRAAGMPVHAICQVCGLSRGALDHLLWGSTLPERGVTYGPGGKVRREIAEVLLAYWPSLDDFPDASLIDACGFRRRLQALMAKGITLAVMAPRCGVNADTLGRALTAPRVRARLARAVRDLYDEWWNVEPETVGVRPEVAVRQRRICVAKGYVLSLAWDDDTIDDPAAVPMLDAAPPAPERGRDAVDRWLLGESVVLDKAGRLRALLYLMEWTPAPVEEIAARLGIEPESVTRQWERALRRAREAGEPVPWRRVYIPELPELEVRTRNASGRFTAAA